MPETMVLVVIGVTAGLVVVVALRAALGLGAAQRRLAETLVEADAQRERLTTVLRSVPHGLVVLDTKGSVLMANRHAAALWGLGVGEIPGVSVSSLSERDVFRCKGEPWTLNELLVLEADVSTDEPTDAPVEIETPGMSRVYEVSQAAVFSPVRGRIGTIVLFRDITLLKEVEVMRENLLHMMVHDLRTPIGGVYTSLLALQADETDDMKQRILDVAVRSAEKVTRMTETMVDIGRMEAGEMPVERADVKMASILESASQQVLPLAQAKGVRLDITVDPKGMQLTVDHSLVERIVINLLGNAIKFTPREGRVSVLATQNAAGDVQVAVEDNGSGIPEPDRVRVFDRFAQAGQRQQWGSGLGLAFCKLAVEAHGGRIWIEGAPVQGSVFKFTLPAIG